MRRLFWIGVGAAVGAYVMRRIGETKQQLTPQGIAANLSDGLRELGAGLGAFGAEVRAGMQDREQELTELVEKRTGGHVPTYGEALREDDPAGVEQTMPLRSARRAPGAGR